MRLLFFLAPLACLAFCKTTAPQNDPRPVIELLVLGIAQDGGYPHAGCRRPCCELAFSKKEKPRHPVSLALKIGPEGELFLFEATPGFAQQWRAAQRLTGFLEKKTPDGIFLTHAHIGHYSGLAQLGREVMGAKAVPVFAMPRMADFLKNNGPWGQLVALNNIDLRPLAADSTVELGGGVRVTPFLVPHRDEYSETVGFRIEGPRRSVLFIPDIDKWGKWPRSIVEEVKKVDLALLDATFFRDGELPGRPMAEVPHPFVAETMVLFADEPPEVRRKVAFIHFNHTNPLLFDKKARQEVFKKGFSLAEEGDRLGL